MNHYYCSVRVNTCILELIILWWHNIRERGIRPRVVPFQCNARCVTFRHVEITRQGWMRIPYMYMSINKILHKYQDIRIDWHCLDVELRESELAFRHFEVDKNPLHQGGKK